MKDPNKKYVAKIRSTYDNEKREIATAGENPMNVHKQIYMKSLKPFEEIHTIVNENGRVVYDIKNGFSYGE